MRATVTVRMDRDALGDEHIERRYVRAIKRHGPENVELWWEVSRREDLTTRDEAELRIRLPGEYADHEGFIFQDGPDRHSSLSFQRVAA